MCDNSLDDAQLAIRCPLDNMRRAHDKPRATPWASSTSFRQSYCFRHVRGSQHRTLEPILLGELFLPFPPGDWNKGHVDRNPDTGEAVFVSTEEVQLAGVGNIWHPVKLDELDLTKQDGVDEKVHFDQRIHVTTHLQLNGGKPVLFKLAVWPWEVPWVEDETAAYQWIKGGGIGPQFQGHVTEGKEGCIIGFVIEWLEGFTVAGPGDMDGCAKVLGRLHELGIKHGDVNKNSFLVRDGHEVVLIDFEATKRDCPAAELEEEIKVLVESKLEGPNRVEYCS
ncbi:hypothetical protein L249_2670 [Ophiocordyceps polyrhachis-furcata BCC 54312]|uniref:Aminoglycoside phosphotransferase domain-containing protein n=1 Tax=Ophiocordyceps polyrhachis-furcata BCC 54312 TaxID=1330021 RepID=A0A367LSJ8_9HYPO|nr:hypothetical protein L249_2670 [Ophiocordyceps polyrhachis-furcata BCC 54312]